MARRSRRPGHAQGNLGPAVRWPGASARMLTVTREGPFWAAAEGRAPLPPAAATLGWELVAINPEEGTIEVAFTAGDAFLNPAGVVQGGFLAAMLDDRFHRGKFDEISDRADAPIEEALAMLVRERLTGMTPPPAARRLVELWRPLLEERAGKNLNKLEKLIDNQARFGDVVHDLLDDLDMGEDRSSEAD